MAKNGFIGIVAGTLAMLCLVLPLGCVDPDEAGGGGSGGGTSLYVFDNATNRILVYSDVASLLNNSEATPDREIRGNLINSSVSNLAWGGMCFDSNNNRLYLVSETGYVVRIDRARSQNGNIFNPTDIVSFRLGESDSQRLSDGKFGQACVDPRSGGTLYVTESNPSDSRIWVVTGPGSLANGANVSDSGILRSWDDNGGTDLATGVAIGGTNGFIYAYFQGGSSVFNPTTGISYAGPRLRRGNLLSPPLPGIPFPLMDSLIIGDLSDSVNKTKLGRYGSLAVDSDGNVFFAKHRDSGDPSDKAVLMFRPGQFNPGMNQPPDDTFSDVVNLRVISHAITRDWLVGAKSDSNGDTGSGTVWIWRLPSRRDLRTEREINLSANLSIRGLALDGSN